MNVFTLSEREAHKKLKAYTTRRPCTQLYRLAETVVREAAQGRAILDLSASIRLGGFDRLMRPKLAIAPADYTEVCFEWKANEKTAHFRVGNQEKYMVRASSRLNIPVNMMQTHKLTRNYSPGRQVCRRVLGYTLVPLIPPDLMPAGSTLRDFAVLWEVARWSDLPTCMTAPEDPLLLKHIAGDLWSVLAQWDLTPLERAIMVENSRRGKPK